MNNGHHPLLECGTLVPHPDSVLRFSLQHLSIQKISHGCPVQLLK